MKFPLIPLLIFSSIFFIQQSIVFSLTISEPPAPAPSHVAMVPSPEPEPKPDHNVTKTFNVLDFGATGDGVSDDTQAFKMAWDSGCRWESPAVVLAPYSYSFLIQPTIFTGPCNSELIFQIDGTIMAPDGPESWPMNVSKRQWLVFYRINGVSFHGGGAIDGRGDKWWDLPCKPHKKGINGTDVVGPCDSPVALRFYRSSNLTIEGLRVKNSPQFHFRFDNCENVEIKSLIIKSPSLSPNTDGIHVENTNNVRIHNSVISNGDDCVSIGGGCHNVDIKNITCGPSHGISIGSLGNHNSRACVSNITVTDAFIRHSDNGVRIKTWQGGYGSVSKIKFDNIHMENVRNPIIIDQYYCLTKNCSNQTSAVNIFDVSYTNIKGTYDVRSPALHLACSDSVPCSSLRLSEIELVPYSQAKFVALPFCWNAYGVMESLVVPPVSCLMQIPPTFVEKNMVDQC